MKAVYKVKMTYLRYVREKKINSVTLFIIFFSIISELNSEFPAIWLVERLLIWRYIHRARRWI